MFTTKILESIFVYSGVLLVLPMLAHTAHQVYVRKSYSIYSYWFFLLCIIAIFSLIFGARYNVGVDYLSYKDSFERLNSGRPGRETYEIGYIIIAKFTGIFEHYFFLFFFFCLVQITFIILAFKRQPSILPWILMVLLSSQHLLTMMTLVRQITFVCFFIWIVSKADKINFPKYTLLIICGSLLFHRSALVLIPFYPIVKYSKSLRIKDSYLVFFYVICLYIGRSEILIDKFEDLSLIINILGYKQYDQFNNVLEAMYMDPNWGPRTYIRFVPPLIAVVMHKQVTSYYKSTTFNRYFNLFLIGIYWQGLFFGTNSIERVFLPCIFLKIVVEGYTLKYLFIQRKRNYKDFLMFLLMASFLFFDFLTIIYETTQPDTTSAFTFFWQN